uniref:TATA-box-binding protein n=1 Tax=Tetranychus urticae TaxID=32264 RepID=T1K5A5_TETUR
MLLVDRFFNITVCAKIIGDFDYEALLRHPGSSYEPELFPGIHLKLDESKVVFIIFKSGKVIITGLKELLKSI